MRNFIIVLFSLLLICHYSNGQEERRGFNKIYFAAGPCISNLTNSEAPHKINIYGSDESPALIFTSDVESLTAYFDYENSLVQVSILD